MGRVTFLGACGTVTGSSTLLAWGGTRLLVDCGMFQGPEEVEQRNFLPFPYRPDELDAVVLTHAHLDHTGLLPRLVAGGFRGPVWCSRASRGLVRLLLEDAGEIQEEEVRYARKKGYSRHPRPEPLFTRADAKETLSLVQTLDFDRLHELLPGIHVRLRRAGHLLGAATVEVLAKGSDGRRRAWCFSGDVGRYGVPILKDPEPPLEAPAALVLESTYGDRTHHPGDAREALARVIRETFARGGSVLVPAFALGRTQEVLYHLAAMADAGELDPAAVFLDSPMAIEATLLYRRAKEEHDEEMAELVENHLGPLRPDRFRFCRTVAQSKELNARREPAVIVAGSGMATGGRIVHHLLHRLADPRHAVAFVGYQAAGTRGRAMLDGADSVTIHGNRVPVRAAVHYLPMLSAHADRDELLRWCRALPAPPERVFLNHGEDPARKVLEAALHQELGWPRPALPGIGTDVPW
ncbi:MAG TPA: MBL fold metallo-hydrolase [Thermoanaerobaculia bacterium]